MIIVVNVINNLDEDVLVNWLRIQMRHNSLQDGVMGTNCPINPNGNFTYQFQVKDQIGSFFYSPSINSPRASSGYGPIIVNTRAMIPLPYAVPYGDIPSMISD
ncbi:hypothetical protein Nepgr_025240 [Nepenthes gracilis]|uniref:Plastocyanin-like domain-containing protein n=1 Tax=Nepenthes gracilis TaxID=150966 RepID=A0AAD3XZC4_NEPGR|nr:hypothetical protein Nepgr_025240 [Nepenthes gracilis]